MVDETYLGLSQLDTAGLSSRSADRALKHHDRASAPAAPILPWDPEDRTASFELDAGPIHARTLQGYLLVDVTTEAKRNGLAGPTAITANVWHDFVALPRRYKGVQGEVGRLRILLSRAGAEVTRFGNSTVTLIEIQVDVSPVSPDGRDCDLVTRTLWLCLEPSDGGRVVWTIMSTRDF